MAQGHAVVSDCLERANRLLEIVTPASGGRRVGLRDIRVRHGTRSGSRFALVWLPHPLGVRVRVRVRVRLPHPLVLDDRLAHSFEMASCECLGASVGNLDVSRR